MKSVFMLEALKEAKKAYNLGEVPVGAVIVKDDKVIAKAHNLCENKNDATMHAELIAIKKAMLKLNTKWLSDCELYVTLEPCPMCAGAIINARVKEVIFGAYDIKGGAVTSKTDLFNLGFNHKPTLYCGIKEKECKELLKDFFKEKR